MNTLPIRSRHCCDPFVIKISSGETENPRRFLYRSAIYCRSGRYPSVVEYCNADLPYCPRTVDAALLIPLTSIRSGFGSPPAKEIIDGFSVTFRISLINDLGVLAIR